MIFELQDTLIAIVRRAHAEQESVSRAGQESEMIELTGDFLVTTNRPADNPVLCDSSCESASKRIDGSIKSRLAQDSASKPAAKKCIDTFCSIDTTINRLQHYCHIIIAFAFVSSLES